MTIPSLRDRWSSHPVLGAWMFLREPMTAEAAARLGYDYVVVDLQHGPLYLDAAVPMLQALSSTPAVPLARSSANNFFDWYSCRFIARPWVR